MMAAAAGIVTASLSAGRWLVAAPTPATPPARPPAVVSRSAVSGVATFRAWSAVLGTRGFAIGIAAGRSLVVVGTESDGVIGNRGFAFGAGPFGTRRRSTFCGFAFGGRVRRGRRFDCFRRNGGLARPGPGRFAGAGASSVSKSMSRSVGGASKSARAAAASSKASSIAGRETWESSPALALVVRRGRVVRFGDPELFSAIQVVQTSQESVTPPGRCRAATRNKGPLLGNRSELESISPQAGGFRPATQDRHATSHRRKKRVWKTNESPRRDNRIGDAWTSGFLFQEGVETPPQETGSPLTEFSQNRDLAKQTVPRTRTDLPDFREEHEAAAQGLAQKLPATSSGNNSLRNIRERNHPDIDTKSSLEGGGC